MSINWLLDVAPPPALLVLPPAAASLDEAHAAIELWEHYSRKTLDPTQRLTVEVMMAQDADGRWAAATTGREMPRQNGKGDEIEVVELWGLVQRAEAILHTVHDAVLLASQAQQRMLAVLERPDLRSKVKRKWMGTGQQMIEMRNGGVVWYRTRTGGGGRGVDDIARLVVDEAQHATEEHLAAVSPTMMANPNPQLNAMGTSGLDGKSDWWWGIRRRALAPSPGNFGYVGHTAERVYVGDRESVIQEPVNIEDRDLWRAVNPALGAGRGGGMKFLEDQFQILSPASFAREHLGVWDPPPGQHGAWVIPALEWHRQADPDAVRPDGVRFALAVDPDRKFASVGACWTRPDGGRHVTLVDRRPGVGWVAELCSKWNSDLVIDPRSPAGALIPDLIADGVRVEEAKASMYPAACGALFDGIVEGAVWHDGDGRLSEAVAAAAKRSSGEAFVWDQRTATADITPLVAVTWALHAVLNTKHIDAAANVW